MNCFRQFHCYLKNTASGLPTAVKELKGVTSGFSLSRKDYKPSECKVLCIQSIYLFLSIPKTGTHFAYFWIRCLLVYRVWEFGVYWLRLQQLTSQQFWRVPECLHKWLALSVLHIYDIRSYSESTPSVRNNILELHISCVHTAVRLLFLFGVQNAAIFIHCSQTV